MKAAVIILSAVGWVATILLNVVHAGVPDLPGILANEDGVSRLREIDLYVNSLRPEEIPAALKKAIAGHGEGREQVIDALSGRWLELDAPAALAFARQTTDREAKGSIQGGYYGAWADRDPEAALKAGNQADNGERADALWEIAHKIGPRDPQQAHDLMRSIHTTKMDDSDYFVFWNWAKTNLPQATQTLNQEAKVAGFSYPCEEEVWAITDRLVDEDPQAAANWMAQLPPGKVHDEAFDRLVSEWKKVDGASLATWLKSLPESNQVRNAIANLQPETSENAPLRFAVDPAFAAKAAELNKILWDSNFWSELEALLPFVDGLTAAEFPQAFAHLTNTPDSHREVVTDVLVERWSRVDPAGAIKAIPLAGMIHDSEFSDRFLADVYAAWTQRDPEAAFAAATRDHPNVGNFRVLWAVFAVLAHQDPVKAYAAFRKLRDSNGQLLITPIFTEWAKRDLSAATKVLPDEGNSAGAIEGIIIGLMRQSPAAAIAWAEQLTPKSDHNRALWDVALRWPDDPQAAAAWLEKSPDFKEKGEAWMDVGVDWANRDPTEELHYATTLADGKEKDVLLYWGLGQLTYDDAEAAQRFARQLPGDEMKKHALATVLATWSEYDPTAAAEFLASIGAEATPWEVAEIADSLSDRDPVSAVHWLGGVSASVGKAPAIGKIAQNWYRTDSTATEQWVNQMPAGPLYDAGARGICNALDSNLAPALKWARSIRDSKARHDAVYQAYEAATNYRVIGFGDDNQGIKDEIQGTPEFNASDKQKLIARLPVLVINRDPAAAPPSSPPSGH